MRATSASFNLTARGDEDIHATSTIPFVVASFGLVDGRQALINIIQLTCQPSPISHSTLGAHRQLLNIKHDSCASNRAPGHHGRSRPSFAAFIDLVPLNPLHAPPCADVYGCPRSSAVCEHEHGGHRPSPTRWLPDLSYSLFLTPKNAVWFQSPVSLPVYEAFARLQTPCRPRRPQPHTDRLPVDPPCIFHHHPAAAKDPPPQRIP